MQLLLPAGGRGRGGELFVLDTGEPVSDAKGGLIETLIQCALNQPDNWVGLRVQLRALVPDFHVPPPPPPADEAAHRPPATSGERRLKLA